MQIIKFIHLFLVGAIFFTLYSCKDSQSEVLLEETEDSHPALVPFSLRVAAENDGLRSLLAFKGTGRNGNIQNEWLTTATKFPVVVVVYKQSTGAFITHETTWQRAKNSPGETLSFEGEQAQLELPKGAKVTDTDLWITAILGGGITKKDQIKADFTADIKSSTSLVTPTALNASFFMPVTPPFVLSWHKLVARVVGKKNVLMLENGGTFRFMATMFAIKPLNRKSSPLTYTGIKVTSNVVVPQATINLGKPTAETTSGEMIPTYTPPANIEVNLFTLASSVTLPVTTAGSLIELRQTPHFFWAPAVIVPSNRKTEIALINGSQEIMVTYYSSTGQPDRRTNYALITEVK